MSFARALPEGLEFTPLPVDGRNGLPQAFPFRFDGVTYHFRLYPNLSAEEVAAQPERWELPLASGGHLVVSVEQEDPGGGRRPLFLRKVLPGLVYEVGQILLTFPDQTLARLNLNGLGEAGSKLSGGIARRWA
ncbi:MAG TPA: hypothetical protein PK413_08955 [Thermoanaerobaculia bacterium]|nr:hypothetical protein [Thermoanaerobaculia bacterium]